MMKANWVVTGIFFGTILFVSLAIGLFDVWLKHYDPTGDDTITWGVILLTYRNPGVAFLMGLFPGLVIGALWAHFWEGEPSPEEWNHLQEITIELAKYRSKFGPIDQISG